LRSASSPLRSISIFRRPLWWHFLDELWKR
jgi:hypothetical protein